MKFGFYSPRLIIGNARVVRAGEWTGSSGPFRLMLAGVAVLIVACLVLGYSNSLLSRL
jgi:L-rhamnose-H+ transport protein